MHRRSSDSFITRAARAGLIRRIAGAVVLVGGAAIGLAADAYGQLGFSAYPFVTVGDTTIIGGTIGIGWKTLKAEYWLNTEIATYKQTFRNEFYYYGFPDQEESVIEGLVIGLYHQPIRFGKRPMGGLIPFFELGAGLGSITRDTQDEKFLAVILAAIGFDIANKFRIRISPSLKLGAEQPFGIQITGFVLLGLGQSITEEIEK